jgi:hypothetical protein
MRAKRPVASAKAKPKTAYWKSWPRSDGLRATPWIKAPNTVPIPTPAPARPMVAIPVMKLLARARVGDGDEGRRTSSLDLSSGNHGGGGALGDDATLLDDIAGHHAGETGTQLHAGGCCWMLAESATRTSCWSSIGGHRTSHDGALDARWCCSEMLARV